MGHKLGLMFGKGIKFAVVGGLTLIHGFFYGLKVFIQDFNKGYQEGVRL